MVELLREVPGLPPVIQAVHILGIAVVMATFVVPHLKVLGVAAFGQSYREMIVRLSPWGWWTLGVMFLSGAVFVVARPFRYVHNPIVAIKFSCLALAVTLSLTTRSRGARAAPDFRNAHKALAALSIVAWVGVILAGRWIAYVDYLFWEG